jgi:hypothetical protein
MKTVKVFLLFICSLLIAPGSDLKAQNDTPEEIVEAQLIAYNAQDQFAFADLFHEDAIIYNNLGDQYPSLTGRDAIRKFYADFFSAFPNNRSEIISRSVQGKFVFDHENIIGRHEPLTIMAIYEVVDGYIVKAWFAR